MATCDLTQGVVYHPQTALDQIPEVIARTARPGPRGHRARHRTEPKEFSLAKSSRRAGLEAPPGRTIQPDVSLPIRHFRPVALAIACLSLQAAYAAAAWKSLPEHANVQWAVADLVSACPAGDSVAAGHPARLRVALRYPTVAQGLVE